MIRLLDRDDAVRLYSKMLEIRLVEDEIQRLFLTGSVRGTTHLCQGQEAVPVGACSVLRPDDKMVCTYRGHGAILAMGSAAEGVFAEILGRASGLCHGRGGSMHLTDVARGSLGSFAIVGAGLAVANGAAWSSQLARSGSVVIAFFGDGATNIGAFHEALNLAGVWRLPVVFICENNLYGEYSPLSSTTPISDLSTRAQSYGMPGVSVDGNDVLAVRETTAHAVELARQGEGPTMIQALTYRFSGHSRSDPAKYRPKGELERWRERDPITRFGSVLASSYGVGEAELQSHRDAVEQLVARARDAALASPEPEASSLLEDVFA